MKPILAITALFSCLALTAQSNAQNYFGNGLPYHGFGYSGSLYGLGYIPVPPYFAIHPPVYYSPQISRSYGDSPFSYAPKRPMPRPKRQIVLNPHVPKAEQTVQNPEEKVAAKIILNPFYDSCEQLAAIQQLQTNLRYLAADPDLAKAD